ncbi:hypothetical protein PBI_SCTP2_47 [Salicola phage SCTP-2]|nr:hypothetical protein PBI_SCTP2_47 [Salicola phage SCTP-2]
MKVKQITEAISSKQIEDHVQDVLKKHLATNDDVKNFTTVVKRALKDILNDYDIEIPTEVSVRSHTKPNYADISVSVDNKKEEAILLTANFLFNKEKMNNDIDNFLFELRQMIVHEMVHVIQTLRANYKDSVSTVRRKDFQHEKSWKEYLSQKKEIEAYAINAAQQLRDKNVDPDKLEKYLKSDELIRKLGNSKMSPTFTDYFDQFFKSSDVRDQRVWKRFMKRFLYHVDELLRDKENINEDDNDSNDEMPKFVREEFSIIGEEQRGKPETVMVRLQHLIGGGVLNVVIEHTGDLIHRMTHQMKYGSDKDGYEAVKEKLNKVLEYIENTDKFLKRIDQELKNNAEWFEKDFEEYREEINKGLLTYARQYDRLVPYNEVHWLAIYAARAVGMQKWDTAKEFLKQLEQYAQSKETWNEKATEYELNESGNLKEYTP